MLKMRRELMILRLRNTRRVRRIDLRPNFLDRPPRRKARRRAPLARRATDIEGAVELKDAWEGCKQRNNRDARDQ